MNSFEFGRPVQICGEVYYINEDMKYVSKVLAKQAKMMQKGSANEAKIKMGSKVAIDTVLGKGAFEKIFKNRAFTINAITTLLIFLTKEIRTWKEELESEIADAMKEEPEFEMDDEIEEDQ